MPAKATANTGRRTFLANSAKTLAAATLVRTLPSHAFAASSERPNILLLLGEGVRHDELHATGNKLIQTPNLDRLVHEGVTFANAFCTNALCSPGRATIMTGQYSHTSGVIDNAERQIPPTSPFFPDLLREAGYEVAYFGKTHVREGFRDHDWDYYFGFDGQADYYHPSIIEGTQGKYQPAKRYDGYVDDLVTAKAVEWLNKPHTRPVFLCMGFFAPHGPFYRSRDLVNLLDGAMIPIPPTFDDDLKNFPGKTDAMREQGNRIGTSELGRATPRSLEEVAKDHYAGVVSNDNNTGKIYAALNNIGGLDKTAVLFTSDHGYFLGEFGMYDKRFMYEPAIRIPFTIRYPQLTAHAGSRISAMALNNDIAQTLLEIAGVPAPTRMQGASVVPFLRGRQPEDWRTEWLYEYYEYPSPEMIRPQRGIRTERYKLIEFYTQDQWELYDLQTDPLERRNLYPDPAQQTRVAELKQRLAALRKSTGDTGKYDVTAEVIRERNNAPKGKARME
jgi:arylsulfatase A-like enzyme